MCKKALTFVAMQGVKEKKIMQHITSWHIYILTLFLKAISDTETIR